MKLVGKSWQVSPSQMPRVMMDVQLAGSSGRVRRTALAFMPGAGSTDTCRPSGVMAVKTASTLYGWAAGTNQPSVTEETVVALTSEWRGMWGGGRLFQNGRHPMLHTQIPFTSKIYCFFVRRCEPRSTCIPSSLRPCREHTDLLLRSAGKLSTCPKSR